MDNMVKTGIVGYTPLNGHPYSFGCILNGFDKETKINQYPQIESYLKKNLDYKNGIKGMKCSHVFCQNKVRAEDIASTIKAKPISDISDFPEDLDLILILCDYSKERDSYIKELSKRYRLFVDKPLIRNESDYKVYLPLIKENKIMSSSMLVHDSQFKFFKSTKGLKEINVIYTGLWKNYASHAIDPVLKIISDQSHLQISNNGENSIFLDNKNLLINFHKEKKNPPNFEYQFIYKNCEKFKVKIKSNFNSFRNGLISLRDIILSGDFYREPNEYKSFLKIYEAIKHE